MTDESERRPRALVVNDTQEILELFQEILEGIGFECVLMSYAPRELDRVREAKPDIIILDFLMGDRELLGWQLLQKLKMDRTLDSIPIVVCRKCGVATTSASISPERIISSTFP